MINYPVDVASTRWTVFEISTSSIMAHGRKWPRADGGEVLGQDPDIAMLLEVEGTQPVFDPAIERLVPLSPVIDVAANTRTREWTVEPIPQQDLDNAAELEAVKAQYAALKAHSGTAESRITRVENVLAYILKEMYA